MCSNQLKRQPSDVTESPSKIINLGILKNSQVLNIISCNDVDNIKESLYREHQKDMPLLPKNLHKVIEATKNREIKSVEGEFFSREGCL